MAKHRVIPVPTPIPIPIPLVEEIEKSQVPKQIQNIINLIQEPGAVICLPFTYTEPLPSITSESATLVTPPEQEQINVYSNGTRLQIQSGLLFVLSGVSKLAVTSSNVVTGCFQVSGVQETTPLPLQEPIEYSEPFNLSQYETAKVTFGGIDIQISEPGISGSITTSGSVNDTSVIHLLFTYTKINIVIPKQNPGNYNIDSPIFYVKGQAQQLPIFKVNLSESIRLGKAISIFDTGNLLNLYSVLLSTKQVNTIYNFEIGNLLNPYIKLSSTQSQSTIEVGQQKEVSVGSPKLYTSISFQT